MLGAQGRMQKVAYKKLHLLFKGSPDIGRGIPERLDRAVELNSTF